MIAYLEGKLAAQGPTYIVMDVGGVGFYVHIPLSSYDVGREVGSRVRLLTYLHVREDVLALYGFATETEKDLFELLISVSGIGPPMAQRILSGISIPEFKQQVASEDIRGLTRIKGVGQKMAQRLVMELRDRIGAVVVEAAEGVVGEAALSRVDEATAALLGLGANPVQARKVVIQVIRSEGEDAPIETIIKLALKRI